MIRAKCWSDDHVREAAFDATPWFAQATDEEILKLAECGWARDYPADAVAGFFEDIVPEVGKMFAYVRLVAHLEDAPGFECAVHPGDARAWLAQSKRSLSLPTPDNDTWEDWEED